VTTEAPSSDPAQVVTEHKEVRRAARRRSLSDRNIIRGAIRQSFSRLNPRNQLKNPVMFVVEVGAILVSLFFFTALLGGNLSGFTIQIAIWLWGTVLFANFAEAMAEGRGKAQAESLRRTKVDTMANKVLEDGTMVLVRGQDLRKGDIVKVEAGDVIPADGTVVRGVASVDESAITGESAPVIRESGGDRSGVTGGTRILSDTLWIKVTVDPGESFMDRMIGLVESAERKKTPNEVALSMLITGLTLIYMVAVVTLAAFASYSGVTVGPVILFALLVCLIPTTIGGLLSAIGIAGMDRLLARNVIAKSGRAVEAAGDVDAILLDKTGTITLGNRQAVEFLPAPGVGPEEIRDVSLLSSIADGTPEGRSVIQLAQKLGGQVPDMMGEQIEFRAETRMSGMNFPGREIRKGAPSAIGKHVQAKGGRVPDEMRSVVERVSKEGGTPLVVSENDRIIGVIYLKDVVKPGIADRLRVLKRMGIKTVMITGDNPLTAKKIADEAGVDEFIAEATPEDKLHFIKAEQNKGQLVAMIGDGTNDAPALAQADVGLAMNSGTDAAREAGNMVDLDSTPTKLIDVIETGKQLLVTRGALTTFSIANDVAKYFAIIPAMFPALPVIAALNIMGLHSPESAILSAVIFNALIIIMLIPLALRGVAFRPAGAANILRRNLLIFGIGGVIVPFIGIKAIDLLITFLGLV
jgi:potassium-transporting ATPase ATP-binding subunit